MSANTLHRKRALANLTGQTEIPDVASGGELNARGVSGGYIALVTAGSETRTLADPTAPNQRLMIYFHTDNGNVTITADSAIDQQSNAAIAFSDVGEFIDLIGVQDAAGTLAWRAVGMDGVFGTETTQNFSASTFSGTVKRTGGDKTAMITLTDADTTLDAANSGKIHLVPDVSADRIYTLPTAAAGLYYEFWSSLVAADGHDVQIVAAAAADFYLGTLLWEDSDLTVGPVIANPDGSTDHTLNILLPIAFNIKMYCDGTNWFITGNVFSAGAPTWT
jgi:hypothetical protein